MFCNKKSKIVILDEAISSIDAETEGKIEQVMSDYMRESSIIKVSHNDHSLKTCEEVFEFTNGVVNKMK